MGKEKQILTGYTNITAVKDALDAAIAKEETSLPSNGQLLDNTIYKGNLEFGSTSTTPPVLKSPTSNKQGSIIDSVTFKNNFSISGPFSGDVPEKDKTYTIGVLNNHWYISESFT